MKLLPYMGAAIGDKYSSAEVIILADDRDGLFTKFLFFNEFSNSKTATVFMFLIILLYLAEVFCMICYLSLRGLK